MSYRQNRKFRRSGRGGFVSFDWSRNPERALSQVAQSSADSPVNESVLHSQVAAADRIQHIRAGIDQAQQQVLLKVQSVIEPEDSLNMVAEKADLYPTQIARAYESAKRADKFQVFKASRVSKPLAHAALYAPQVVPREHVMMTHQGAVMPYIGLDKRSSIGIDITPRKSRHKMPSVLWPASVASKAQPVHSESETEGYACSRTSGCGHLNRQWLRARFADFRLTCLDCKDELGQKNPFSGVL